MNIAAPHSRLLIKGGIVLTLDPSAGDFAVGDVLVEGEKILAVGHDLPVENAEVIDARGMIVMPGLIDAHRHAWQGTLRRLMPNVATLGDYINATHFSLAKHYRPLDMYLGNYATALTCLDAGITTIIDASHNARSAEHSHASIDAYENAGLRALYMPGKPLAGEWAEDWPAGLEQLQADRFSSRSQLVTLGMFAQPDAGNWTIARHLGLPILSEFLGVMAPMLPQLHADRLLGPDNIFNHCTSLPDSAWRILQEAGVKVTVDARSDAQYGLEGGVFAYQAALDHGIKPGLGTDLETAYGGDMFTEMKVAFFMQRAMAQAARHRGDAHLPTPVSVQQILQSATIDGARCAGLADSTGSITPGKQADIILIRAGDINLHPVNNAVGAVVHAADRSNVDTVMVAGRLRKRHGKLLDVDQAKMQREVAASVEHLFNAGGYRQDIFETSFPELAGDKPPAWQG